MYLMFIHAPLSICYDTHALFQLHFCYILYSYCSFVYISNGLTEIKIKVQAQSIKVYERDSINTVIIMITRV